MKPAAFDYLAARSEAEALEALSEAGENARLLAGGQTLLPMLNMRLVEPMLLVDISRLSDGDPVRRIDDAIEVNASTTQCALEEWPDLPTAAPLVAAALPLLGHFQTRNKGTVCGSIAFADPSAELPLCLAVLGGTVVLRSTRGERVVTAAKFQTGLLSTARAADEMITAVRFPVADPADGHAFIELARRHGDFAIVAVAVRATRSAVRIGIGGVADRPAVRDWPADISGDALDDALNTLAWELDAADDPHASADYRRGLVRRLGRKAVLEACACRG